MTAPNQRSFAWALATCALALAAPAHADLKLPAVIGDHMVLQREAEVPLWGWDTPRTRVTVRASWLSEPVSTTAGEDGAWRVTLQTPEAGGPYSVTIRGSAEASLSDVLIGEVWVCSGQSNMEWSLTHISSVEAGLPNGPAEIAGAVHPELRLFDVERAYAHTPQKDCGGEWRPCTPESVANFSATGYFFGRRLLQNLDVPIGLIGSNWGGTPAEAWTSPAGMDRRDDFVEERALVKKAAEMAQSFAEEKEARIAAFWKELAAKDDGSAEGGWMSPELDDSGWDAMSLPQNWERAGLENTDGVVWFRRTVDVPDEWRGQELSLSLGPIDDMDTTWLNGERVGGYEREGAWNTPRRYAIPAAAVKAGPNVIAVRVYDWGGGGGLHGAPEDMKLSAPDGSSLDLFGDWRFRAGAPISELPKWPTVEQPGHRSPSALYNGMIAPIVPFGIRGVIWYQGESNRTRAYQYRSLFPDMIASWREAWSIGNFPFYFVQIAPFGYGNDRGQAAELREAQFMALSLPNTGMAVTMDVGNPADIHPKDKVSVGERLALWALAKTFGRDDVAFSGPLYKTLRVERGAIRLFFDHTFGGLVSRGGSLTHFQVAGENRTFAPAEATIDGDSIVVRSDAVQNPVAVRYAWGAADEPNLFNGAGLPASSFRTDDWPGLTEPAR